MYFRSSSSDVVRVDKSNALIRAFNIRSRFVMCKIRGSMQPILLHKPPLDTCILSFGEVFQCCIHRYNC